MCDTYHEELFSISIKARKIWWESSNGESGEGFFKNNLGGLCAGDPDGDYVEIEICTKCLKVLNTTSKELQDDINNLSIIND